MNKFLFGLIVAVAYGNVCNAYPVTNLNIVHARGDSGFSYLRAKELIQAGSARISKETGAPLTLLSFRSVRDPFAYRSATLSIAQRKQKLHLWDRYFQRRVGKRGVNLAIIPPIREAGRLWFAGISERVCRGFGATAYINVGERNADGELRWASSITAYMHELSHAAYGLLHDNELPATVMNEDALGYMVRYGAKEPLKFSKKSIEEVRRCLTTNQRKNEERG